MRPHVGLWISLAVAAGYLAAGCSTMGSGGWASGRGRSMPPAVSTPSKVTSPTTAAGKGVTNTTAVGRTAESSLAASAAGSTGGTAIAKSAAVTTSTVARATSATGTVAGSAARTGTAPSAGDAVAPRAGGASNVVVAGTEGRDLAGLEVVGSNVVRRPHLRMKDKKSEEQFLRLVGNKGNRTTELTALQRILAEKTLELQKCNTTLTERFSIKPEVNYQYEADALSIFEVPASGDAKRRLHRKLKDRQEGQEFVRLATAKKLVRSEIASLQLLLREKQMEKDQVDVQLKQDFAMAKDRYYQYDPSSMTLYELTVLPPGAKLPSAAERVPVK